MRESLAAIGLLLVVLGILAKCTGCATLTPADKKSIARDAVEIAKCQTFGRMCKSDKGQTDCFAVYDDCIIDAGLRQ